MTAEVYQVLEPDTQIAFRYSLPPNEASMITKTVFDKLGVDLIHRTGKARKHEQVEARQISMYLIKLKTRASLKNIGRHFNRDHSTVIHSIETVQDLMQTNRYYKHTIEELLEILA